MELRVGRKMNLGGRYRLELTGESFNLFNRDNQRYGVTDNGYYNSAGTFVKYSQSAGGANYPAYYQQTTSFMKPTSSFSLRRMQLSMRRGILTKVKIFYNFTDLHMPRLS